MTQKDFAIFMNTQIGLLLVQLVLTRGHKCIVKMRGCSAECGMVDAGDLCIVLFRNADRCQPLKDN